MKTIVRTFGFIILFSCVAILTKFVANSLISIILISATTLFMMAGLIAYIITNKVYNKIT